MKRALFIIITFTIIAVSQNDASAFWGIESRQHPSGLDFTSGYDVNTVTTIHGIVINPPARINMSEHSQMTIATLHGTVTVVLGPWSNWDRQGFTIIRDQDISITGSRAQGKDGSIYLFAQKIDNITTGATITLRSETGSPMLSRSGPGSGRASGSVSGAGQHSGSGPGTGSGYRGGSIRGGSRR